MKITWFGGPTFRIYAGGQIIVTYPASAPEGISRLEIESGADHLIDIADPPPQILDWRPRLAPALVHETGRQQIEIVNLPEAGLGIAAAGEPPLILADTDLGAVTEFLEPRPRWGLSAIVALYSGSSSASSLAIGAERVLMGLAPKLIAVAASDNDLEEVWGSLAGRLNETGLVALELGLALEV